ncbi:MAG: CotH kinase family protein [Saprospiraceae bacterium]
MQISEQRIKDQPVELTFSRQGGFYTDEIELELYSPDTKIYYTIDGSRPSRHSERYRKPIQIEETMVVRAVAYRGRKKSKVAGHTFFIDEEASNFPTVSLSLAAKTLFDPDGGMFMKGKNAVDSIWSMPGANFWSRKEVRVNTEFFEADGSNSFRSETGMRLFGGMSRLFPQKSLVLVTRSKYGKKHFKNRPLGEEGAKKYKFLVLRNSGSDFGKTHFRDGLMTGLVEDWDMEKQAFQPAHVYINGKYWGIYNIREKINRYFLAEHSEYHKDSVDLIEHRWTRKRGSRRHYDKLLKFIREHDLREPANYAYVQSQMDVANFMDYKIAQIFFDNQDAGGNIKFWRPQTQGGRWRWILYDTDWGFGLHDAYAYKNNSLAFHTEPNGPSWPNPPWSTFLLRNLLENADFQRQFINRFADHLNSVFQSKTIERDIDRLYTNLLAEIPRHLQRWQLSEDRWEEQVHILYNFAKKRPAYVRQHLGEMFDIGEERHIQINNTFGGQVYVNENLILENETFSGTYFEKIPIKLRAIPHFGYRFSHWEGFSEREIARSLTIQLGKEKTRVYAVFEKFDHPLEGQVILNEVSANNKKTGDWIELFNYTEETIDLTDWVLTDLKNEFHIPNVEIAPNDYLVICQDSTRFLQQHPLAYNVIGGMDFGINKRYETLQLFTANGAAIDSMGYEIPPTDSVFTFNLLLPHLDNADIENWELRRGEGSPNKPNPYYVESTIRTQQEQYMQIGVAGALLLVCIFLLIMKKRRRTIGVNEKVEW